MPCQALCSWTGMDVGTLWVVGFRRFDGDRSKPSRLENAQ
jgi:hypothetical protein